MKQTLAALNRLSKLKASPSYSMSDGPASNFTAVVTQSTTAIVNMRQIAVIAMRRGNATPNQSLTQSDSPTFMMARAMLQAPATPRPYQTLRGRSSQLLADSAMRSSQIGPNTWLAYRIQLERNGNWERSQSRSREVGHATVT